nr:putative DNA gyrase inhibitor YacG [uncultured bacterium]
MHLSGAPPDISMDKHLPARTVTCPTCKGESRYATDNPWRPFCSERCRNADLGAWASESFRVEEGPSSSADDTDQDLPRH